jgi:RNA polymerase sigma factor (sigma-70 family)
MAKKSFNGVLQHLRKVAAVQTCHGSSDRELLERFVEAKDEGAFTVLIERHGPMVLGICRRALANSHDAEDACQATFLVLARKAASVRKKTSLGSWLHGVACRVAASLTRDRARRKTRELGVDARAPRDPAAEVTWQEVQTVLDEELQRLPDRYRAPLILCYLECLTRDQAAQQLGLSPTTLYGRLERARDLLRECLTKRGLTLAAAISAIALGEGTTHAALAPTFVVSSTKAALLLAAGQPLTESVVATHVLALTQEVLSKTMPMTKLKTVILCLAITSLVALGVAVKEDASAKPPVKGQAEPLRLAAIGHPGDEQAKPEGQPKAAIEEAGETVTFRGRVLDPDGKPLTGAEVTLWAHFGYDGAYSLEWHPETAGPFRPKLLAKSGEDGRFTATFHKSDVTENPLNMWEQPWRLVQVVAAAKGYGPDWASLVSLDKGELTLRLAKDDVPIKGRVLDLEGRPVVGATIQVARVTIGGNLHHSLWQSSWAGLTGDLTTDREGRFSLTGVGRGREVLLSIEGPGIEHKLVEVKTPAADRGSTPGPEVEIVAGPTKSVEGTIVAKGTGKPLAGIVVYGDEEAHHRRVRTVTDERGRYRLIGLPKAEAYRLSVYPPVDTGYLGTSQAVVGSEGLRPVTADIELRRGVEVRCRLIDKVTREPVRGELRYTPLTTNPFYGEAELSPGLIPSREFGRHRVPDPDGIFRFMTYPGPGLLVVILQGNMGRYLPDRIDPADLAKTQGDHHMEFAKLFGIYRLIDPKEGDKPLVVDIEVDPGRKASGSLIGPDGKPVNGATAYGLHHHPHKGMERPAESLKADAFTATLLDPERPRTVSFVHKDRKLIGHAVLRGDEKGPVTVRLVPWGVLTGRLVDDDGKPVAGVRLGWTYPSLSPPGMAPPGEAFTTDGAGRFRVEGLAPGSKFEIILSGGAKKDTPFSAGEALKGHVLEPGQTKDLGDVRVKAASKPQKTEGGND